MSFKQLFPYTVCSVLTLALSAPLQAACPKLDLNTLPKALCAAGMMFDDMKYNSSETTKADCQDTSKKTAFAKTLQGLFKGSKTYEGTEANKKPGLVSCEYTLSAPWQAFLNTKDTSFTVQAVVNDVSFGLVKKSMCPDMTAQNVQGLQSGSKLETTQSKVSGGQTLVWKMPKTLSRDKLFGGSNTAPTGTLTGKQQIVTPFSHTCTYTYHPGGVATSFTLTGTQVQ